MLAALRHAPLIIAATALVASCNADTPAGSPATCRSPASCARMDVLIAMGDLSSSGVGAVSLDGEQTGYFGVDLGKDPQIATSQGRAFFIARDLDGIFEVSASCGEPLCRFSAHHEGRTGTTNPQDVAVAPDGSLWAPRFATPDIAIIGREGRERATVALPDLDGDGNPNASAIRIVDVDGAAKAFVALELLDDAALFRSRRSSALAVFDVASMKLERTIDLKGRNPFNTIVEHGKYFYFTAAGNFDAADERDGGIERLDPRHPEDDRLLLSEVELGGTPSAVAVRDGCAAAIVSDATKVNATAVVTFNPDTGETIRTASKGGPLFGPSEDFDLWAIAWAGDRLLVGDRRRGARGYPIHVFEPGASTCEFVERAEPLFVPQKPIAMRAVH